MPDQQGFCSQKTISFFLCNPSIAHDKFTMLRMRRPRRTITIALAGTPATQEQGTCLCPSPPYSSCPRSPVAEAPGCLAKANVLFLVFARTMCCTCTLPPDNCIAPVHKCLLLPSRHRAILQSYHLVLRPSSCVLRPCSLRSFVYL